MYDPWRFAWDMNADGVFTITDLWLLLAGIFFLPGDTLLLWLLTEAPGVATFLELSTDNYQGFLSGFVSGILWVVAFVSVLGAVTRQKAIYDERETVAYRDKLREVGYEDEED